MVEKRADVVDLIRLELERRRPELTRLFAVPGKLIVHVNASSDKPVQLEVNVRL